ncbi:MAG: zinc carboxypeptidase, partial [Chitinophagia bacterium]|nr:zinc carboxypeptidase [Chitinophagia bacterium]
SRGHLQESVNGPLSFHFTIRNQFTTMLSTLDAAKHMRKRLLDYQRDFYLEAAKEAAASPVKAYVFGDAQDPQRTAAMVQMLLRHQIEIYSLKSDLNAGGSTFTANRSYVVPFAQTQSKLIKSIFERNTKFEDSLFYDISAWTIPLAMGVPFAELSTWNAEQLAGPRVMKAVSGFTPVEKSPYAYVIDWRAYNAPVALYHLQSKGLLTKVATTTFESGASKFGYGDIIIPVFNQPVPPDEVFAIVRQAQELAQVGITPVSTGLSTAGVDLGSSSLQSIRKPVVMVFAGAGTSATDVGEIWHLFDQRYGIPASLLEVESFNRIDPSRYSVIIMPSGTYGGLGKEGQEKLRNWVSLGGTLVATEDAVQYLSNAGLTKVAFRKDGLREDSSATRPYENRVEDRRAVDMPGSIFEARIDPTHPICFGYTRPLMSLFKSNNLFMEKNRSAYNTPVRFTEKPLQAGYLHSRFTKAAPGSASVNIDAIGRGRVVSMTENPNFRAFWFGTNRLLMNAVFFGGIIEAR